MAVVKIKVTNIIGRMNELDKVTSICGRSSVFHPDNALSFYSDTSDFMAISEENPFTEPLSRLTETASGIKKDLYVLSVEETEQLSLKDEELDPYVKGISRTFGDLVNQRNGAQQRIQTNRQISEDVGHFLGLDLDLKEIFACEFIKVRFGSLPKDSFDKLNSLDDNPYVLFFPCTSDDSRYWGVYFAPIEEVREVDRIFSSLYFERLRLPAAAESPEASVKLLQGMMDQDTKLIEEIEKNIDSVWEQERFTCLQVYSRLTEKNIYFSIRRYGARYSDSFILTGWIPAGSEEQLKDELDELESVEYAFDGAEEELSHSPPIKLKNKRLFQPFEFYVDLYGLPSYNEADPTPFVAITYTLLFGIMFGDFGQGLLLALVGYFMWKLKNMKLGLILTRCGISAAFFGLVFGSVFGFEEAVNPLYKILFGWKDKPIKVMEPATSTLIIYAAVGIGAALVLVAMIANMYSSLRRKNYENAIFGPNGIAGFILYASVVLGFGGQLAFGLNIISVPYVICLIIIPLIVIFLREVLGKLVEGDPHWLPKSWGDYIMQNFFEVFEFLLSYVTNTMSFLRVGVFVLVHSGMMIVVFTLAEMSSGVMYILVLALGNALVIALEGLLVSIQVLRLEFYEMFSRFFDGEGRPFTPVTVPRGAK